MKIFEVGGCIRDELLGIQSKDIDFAVEAQSFEAMREMMVDQGFVIFLENPECFTIRAKFPAWHINKGLVADFVLCRKESGSLDNRHPEFVEAGSIFDDLARRDFTVNAMAKDVETGELLDPHGGKDDLAAGILRFVGDPMQRIQDDGLRVLRAIRFAITKRFEFHPETWAAISDPAVANFLGGVSTDRKREELLKAFKADSLAAFRLIAKLPDETQEAIFSDTALWLKPTTEK